MNQTGPKNWYESPTTVDIHFGMCVYRWSVTQSQIDGMKVACCNDIFRSSWVSLPAGSCNKLKQIEGHPLIICPSPALRQRPYSRQLLFQL